MALNHKLKLLAFSLMALFWSSSCSPILPSLPLSSTAANIPTRIFQSTSAPKSEPEVLDEYFLPPYYSDAYPSIIEAAKLENELLIYSNIDKGSWKSAIETFNGHFPWIEVKVIDLGANEVFERYSADQSAGEKSADLIVSNDPEGWLIFANIGQVAPYLSEEELYIPPWTKIAPGIYTIASDPLVIFYNKETFADPPQSMEEIAGIVTGNPANFNGDITSYDATQNSIGLSVNWFWLDHLGETGWGILRSIGNSAPALKTSSSSMVSSIYNNETSIAYFVSPFAFYDEVDKHPNIGWSFIKDGQPVLMRSIALTRNAKSPNAAKLMIDFLMSQEGQLALAMGGLTPYRSDISNVDIFQAGSGSQGRIHFDQVIEAVGIENIIFINLDPNLIDPVKRVEFIEKWNLAIGR